MGLLDVVGGMFSSGAQADPLGQIGAGGQGGSAELIAAVIGMLAGGAAQGGMPGGAGGGLAGLIESFRANGMGEIADSWVSSGQNLPVSSDQLGQVLGPQQMSELASRFGLSTGDLGAQVAQALPQAVDRLTPGGQLPEGGLGGLGDLLGMLTRR